MTAALLAALAGVLGVTIGRFWDTRSESDRWQRDKRVASYQCLVDQFDLVFGEIRKPLVSDVNPDVLQAIWVDRRTIWSDWLSAVAGVWLHGSTEVVMATTTVDRALASLEMAVAEKRVATIADWKLARVPVHEAFAGFVTAARKDVGLRTVPVVYLDHYPDPVV